MEKGRFKWYLALLACVLAAVVCGVCIFVYTRPKMILTSALPKLFSQLEERFRDDPLRMAAEVFDKDGQYTADVLLRTGPVTYDITAQTDFSKHCFFADGTVCGSEKAVDICLYLDESIAAVSSEELSKGNYYGIAFDSFASDIRGIPLFSPFVSEEMLCQWTDSARRIQEAMSWEYPQISLPTLSNQEIRQLLLGIAALPCAREMVSAPINGEILSCLKLQFFLDGEQLGAILGEAAEKNTSKDTSVSASFYLYDESVVKLLIQDQQGRDIHVYAITFGKDPLHNTLTLEENENLSGEQKAYRIGVETKRQDNSLTQTIRYSNGQSVPAVITYQWEKEAGILYLKTGADSEAAKVLLSQGNNGLEIKTDDLGHLIQILTRNACDWNFFDSAACSMTVRSGAQIRTPTYKNVDSWSFEDLLLLFGGIGSVVGWNMA